MKTSIRRFWPAEKNSGELCDASPAGLIFASDVAPSAASSYSIQLGAGSPGIDLAREVRRALPNTLVSTHSIDSMAFGISDRKSATGWEQCRSREEAKARWQQLEPAYIWDLCCFCMRRMEFENAPIVPSCIIAQGVLIAALR